LKLQAQAHLADAKQANSADTLNSNCITVFIRSQIDNTEATGGNFLYNAVTGDFQTIWQGALFCAAIVVSIL
jgi:hypothetical protein